MIVLAGALHPKILLRHIVPGVINTAVVIDALTVGNLILAKAALQLLRSGLPLSTPAWGIGVGAGVHDEVHVSHRKGNLPVRLGGAIVRLIPSSRIFGCMYFTVGNIGYKW